MYYKNLWNDIKKKIPYHILLKSIIQISVLLFSFSVSYYGIHLLKLSAKSMQYDFSQTDSMIDEVDDEQETEKNDSSKININTATKTELMTLPNIGAKKADEIIKYREGEEFTDIADLMEVSGIGVKTYETLMDAITV